MPTVDRWEMAMWIEVDSIRNSLPLFASAYGPWMHQVPTALAEELGGGPRD